MLCICQEARLVLFLHAILLSKHAYRILMGMPKGKRPQEDLDIGRRALVNTVMNLRIP
jgi:hypothetical protein